MSEAIKPTPGPWEAIEKQDADPSEGSHFLRCPIGALGYWRGHKRAHEDCHWVLTGSDANLIAEAGTVHHETGLTPRQLVERVKGLEEALRRLLNAELDTHLTVQGVRNLARAALSKSLQNTVAEVKE